MKKLLAILLVCLLAALAPMAVFATETEINPTDSNPIEIDDPTLVTASANASYVITIPEAIDFGTINRLSGLRTVDISVDISDALLADNSTVSVSLSTDFTMYDMEGAGTTPLGYKIYNEAADGTELADGELYCVFKAGNAKAGQTKISDTTFSAERAGRATALSSELKRAGSYRDYIVFTCSYKDPYASASKPSGTVDSTAAPIVETIEGVKTVNINTADDLINFAAAINASPNSTKYNNSVIDINDNINLIGFDWMPIKAIFGALSGVTINGNENTIYNLTSTNHGHTTAFISTYAASNPLTINDLSFVNPKITANGINAAVLIGHTYSDVNLNNVDITGGSTTGYYKVAAYIGTLYDENDTTGADVVMTGCDLSNHSITGLQYGAYCLAGYIGWASCYENETVSFTNCTIDGLSITYNGGSYEYAAYVFLDEYENGVVDNVNECEGVTVTNSRFIVK